MTDDRLRLLVERIERVSEEISGLQQDRRDIYAEAKAVGYDARVIREVIARRAVAPADRAAGDAILASYEAALGMAEADDAYAGPIVRADVAELAAQLLAEEITGLEDPDHAAALVGHMLFILDLRAEVRAMRAEETARKKLAASEGFDAKQIGAAVRWFEKVAKHGVDAMRLGEQTFRLYRGTFEARGADAGSATDDPKLKALFAAPAPATLPKKARAVAMARAAAANARRALRGEI
jgi:uncharacterized protein (UPF0335 family)